MLVTNLVVTDSHLFFKNSTFVPSGYEDLDNSMQVYVYDLSMHITYTTLSLLVLLLVPKKDLVLFLITIANFVLRTMDLIDFLLYNNQGYINIKDYIVVITFLIAIIYGVRTYRRKKGDTEEIVNVTNIALLKMLVPNKEVITVNTLMEEKEKVNTEYNNLLYHLQHQIKQPFTSLEGLMQLEESELRQQMIAKCIHDVKSYLHELTHLDYISNYYKLNPQPISYRKIFNDVKAKVFNSNKVHIHYYESKVEGFKMDEILFGTILEKLLQNAINFSKDSTFQRSNVYIYVYTNSPSELILEVKDEGVGIEEQSRDKIFEMFFKGSLKSSGVGLGLYIVKKTAEKLNGKIIVESKLNYGSSFKIAIPQIKETTIVEAKNTPAESMS